MGRIRGFLFRKTRDAVLVLPATYLDGLEPNLGRVRLTERPLREGAFWYGDPEHSVTFEVMVREDVVVPAGYFRDCFRIRIHADEPCTMNFRLAPNAGIVRRTRRFSVVRSGCRNVLVPARPALYTGSFLRHTLAPRLCDTHLSRHRMPNSFLILTLVFSGLGGEFGEVPRENV
jgi:hypothetical protein